MPGRNTRLSSGLESDFQSGDEVGFSGDVGEAEVSTFERKIGAIRRAATPSILASARVVLGAGERNRLGVPVLRLRNQGGFACHIGEAEVAAFEGAGEGIARAVAGAQLGAGFCGPN